MRHVIVAALLAVLASVAAAHAQPLQPTIYHRVIVEPRPGGEAVVAFFLGTLRDGEPNPIPDASYSAQAILGGRAVELPVTVSGGIAYARVRIPLEHLLGGGLVLNLSAASESYLMRAHKAVALSYGPDYPALAALALAVAPSAVALVLVLRRRVGA